MAERIRRFVPRAFRYVLRPQDKNAMRFSLNDPHGPSAINQTLLVNLSESGVAFLVSPDTRVQMHERMKVEIPVPGGEQIAWWGTVVRLQEYEPRAWMFGGDPFRDDPKILVAVRFDDLPEGHTRAIRKGLEQSFMQAMRDQQFRNWLYYRTLAQQYFWRVFFSVAALAFTIAFLWYFTRPSANYDADKGAPWGERFKLDRPNN